MDGNIGTQQTRKQKRKQCGRQACVYHPPLPCNSRLDLSSVGKVHFQEPTGVRELKNLRLVERMGLGQYVAGLAGQGHCRTRRGKLQILLRRAEATLSEDLQNGRDPLVVFSKLGALLRGLAMLGMQGYAHMDISPDNIVRMGDRYVLIDFGNMMRLSDIFSSRNPYLTATFAFNPPEFKISSGMPDKVHENYPSWLAIDTTGLDDLARRWRPSMSGAAAAKADVFSFGVLLLWVATGLRRLLDLRDVEPGQHRRRSEIRAAKDRGLCAVGWTSSSSRSGSQSWSSWPLREIGTANRRRGCGTWPPICTTSKLTKKTACSWATRPVVTAISPTATSSLRDAPASSSRPPMKNSNDWNPSQSISRASFQPVEF